MKNRNTRRAVLILLLLSLTSPAAAACNPGGEAAKVVEKVGPAIRDHPGGVGAGVGGGAVVCQQTACS